jgi:MFS family permease
VGPTSAMGLSEPAYGALLTATAAGGLLGSLVAERVERRIGRARSLVLTLVGGAVLVGAPAATVNPVLIGAAFFVGGVTIAIWNVITVSLRQRVTPDRLLGRLNSAYRLLAWGSRPLGAVAGGVLAEVFGLRAVFAVMAVLTLGLVIGMTRLTDEAMEAAERDAEPG